MTGGLWPGERSPDERRTPDTAPLRTIDVVAAWPEIAASVPPADRQLARRALVARVVTAEDADLFDVLGASARGAFAFLIVEGVVLKATTFAGRSALELFGPGDLLAPPLRRLSD